MTFPDSIEYIGERAFRYCSSLENIILPNNLEYIGDFAFRECVSLKSVTIPSGEFGDYVFYGCSALTSVSLGRYVDFVEGDSFRNCNSLGSISIDANNPYYTVVDNVLFTKDKKMLVKYPANKADAAYSIPEGVTTIDMFAFQYCPALKSVFIPKSLTMTDLFRECKSLASILVDENNPSNTSLEGVLFTKDKKMLRQYPAAKEGAAYRIPSGVTQLNTLAFGWNQFLTSMTVPKEVIGMGPSTFAYSKSLVNVTIESGVPMLSDNVFMACPELVAVSIPNSVTSIGTNAFIECLKLTLYCNQNSTAHTYAVNNGLKYSFNPLPTYTVTFDTDKGSAIDPITNMAPGSQIEKPADPVKPNYTFAGWYKDKACTQAWDFSNAILSDTTLYAKWMLNTCTVNFNSQKGSTVKSQTVAVGGAVKKPTNPTRKGYVFSGWYTDNSCKKAYDFKKKVTSDITLYSKWTVIKGKITPPTKKINEGKKLKLTATGNAPIKSVKWTNSNSKAASIKISGKSKINCTVTGKKKTKRLPSLP